MTGLGRRCVRCGARWVAGHACRNAPTGLTRRARLARIVDDELRQAADPGLTPLDEDGEYDGDLRDDQPPGAA